MSERQCLVVILTTVLLPFTLLVTGCDLDCTIDRINCWKDDCGAIITKEFDISGFDELECGDAFDLTVRQGNGFRVSVTFPERLDDDRIVRREGDRLLIGLDGCPCGGGGARRAVIELPRLRRVAVNNASRVTLEQIDSPETLGIELSGASSVIGNVSANETRIRISGASRAELLGSTTKVDLTASGASRANLAEFDAWVADIRLSGASQATVWVRELLDVTASGGSRLHYLGDPRIGRLDLSGGSRVEHLD